MSYTVEWNYDRENHRSLRWFSYSADAIRSPRCVNAGVGSPLVFADLDEAREVFDMLVRTYYAPNYRIVDETGKVIQEGKSRVNFQEGYWDE